MSEQSVKPVVVIAVGVIASMSFNTGYDIGIMSSAKRLMAQCSEHAACHGTDCRVRRSSRRQLQDTRHARRGQHDACRKTWLGPRGPLAFLLWALLG